MSDAPMTGEQLERASFIFRGVMDWNSEKERPTDFVVGSTGLDVTNEVRRLQNQYDAAWREVVARGKDIASLETECEHLRQQLAPFECGTEPNSLAGRCTEAVQTENVKLRALLKKHEWTSIHMSSDTCNSCGNGKCEGKGHKPNCQWKAVMG